MKGRGIKGERLTKNPDTKETVLRYLAKHHTMTIATVQNGTPWAAAVFYANDDFTLYYLSDPASRHSLEISANPPVAVTVHEDYHDWRQIKGLQMAGTASLVTDEEEMERAVSAYAAKYPFTTVYLKLLASPFPRIAGRLDRLLGKLPFTPGLPADFNVRFYRVSLSRGRFTDNTKGFGHHEEFSLE